MRPQYVSLLIIHIVIKKNDDTVAVTGEEYLHNVVEYALVDLFLITPLDRHTKVFVEQASPVKNFWDLYSHLQRLD